MRLPRWLLLLGLAGLFGGCVSSTASGPRTTPGPTPHTFVYVGTSGANRGEIAIYQLDLTVGDLTRRGQQTLGDSPAALAGDRDGRILVAALERGATVSFSIEPRTGALRSRGRAITGGAGPARATLDGTGKYALVTNRGSGNVSVLAIKPDQSLDTPDVFSAGRGPHGLALHPDNQVAFVANTKGGTLSQFSFNAGTGFLTPKPDASAKMPWDSGPRQVVCHPNGRFTYILNETSDAITVFSFDDRMGSLSRMPFQTISTLPEGAPADASRPGDLTIDPRGLYLYASNTGSDTVASFAINQQTGGLTPIGHQPSGGRGLEDLAIDPAGRYLLGANRRSRDLSIFLLDERTGVPGKLAQIPLSASPRALHVARAVPES